MSKKYTVVQACNICRKYYTKHGIHVHFSPGSQHETPDHLEVEGGFLSEFAREQSSTTLPRRSRL
jgi:hypothetical protein